MTVHHGLDGDIDSDGEDQYDGGEDTAYLRDQGQEAGDEADENPEHALNAEDGPFLTEGGFVTQGEGLDRGNLLLDQEIDGIAPCDSHDDTGNEGKEGTVICEQIKFIDPAIRACTRVDHVSYSDIMEVSDTIQGIFEYD